MQTVDIIKQVLDEYVGSQLNIDSDAARQELSMRISQRVEYHQSQDDFWQRINEDI